MNLEMDEQPFPLSFAQRMFWFLDHFQPETPAYNLTRALQITGELDIPDTPRWYLKLQKRIIRSD